VVMTNNGLGAVPSSHPLGFAALALPHLLPDADAILAIGTRLIQGGGRVVTPPVGAVHPDRRPTVASSSGAVPPTIGIVADAKLALASLVDLVGSNNRSRPDRSAELAALKSMVAEDIGTIEPQGSFGKVLREEMPDDSIFVGESTQVGYWLQSSA